MEELFILHKMIEGDQSAFRYFYDRYYVDLCNFVNIYVNQKALAEEIVQDIFVSFWENRLRLQMHRSVKSYLFSASKYRSLNEIRNRITREKVFERLKKEGHDFQADRDFQVEEKESYLDPDKFTAVLHAVIGKLPPKCREIFLLSKNSELSNKEIAEKLDISVKTVENQMTIALKKLREYLAPYREEIFILFLVHLLSS